MMYFPLLPLPPVSVHMQRVFSKETVVEDFITDFTLKQTHIV